MDDDGKVIQPSCTFSQAAQGNNRLPEIFPVFQAACLGRLSRSGISHEFLDLTVNGLRPNIISLGCQMQGIVHDFFANGFVGLKEFVTDVQVMNRAIGKL